MKKHGEAQPPETHFFDFIIIAWQSEGAINQSIASAPHTPGDKKVTFFTKFRKIDFV
jgi:hypothetical protein